MSFDMWPKRRKEKKAGDLPAILPEPMVQLMTGSDLNECWRLDQECFADGEAYDRETIRYLLNHTQSICYKVVAPTGGMLAFVVGMLEANETGHVVAIGVGPDHRRRGFGRRLMQTVEDSFRQNGVRTIRLEVRTSNEAAQRLYHELGFRIVRRMPRYYTSGDDGYLMIKDLA